MQTPQPAMLSEARAHGHHATVPMPFHHTSMPSPVSAHQAYSLDLSTSVSVSSPSSPYPVPISSYLRPPAATTHADSHAVTAPHLPLYLSMASALAPTPPSHQHAAPQPQHSPAAQAPTWSQPHICPCTFPWHHPFPPHLPAFSACAGSHAVMTPGQAYSALKEEGFHVNYMRTPLTDGAAPREIVFDTFYAGVSAASPLDPVIFNDQMGAGRTTTGMVIACMIRSFMDPGAPLPGCVLRHAQPHLLM